MSLTSINKKKINLEIFPYVKIIKLKKKFFGNKFEPSYENLKFRVFFIQTVKT